MVSKFVVFVRCSIVVGVSLQHGVVDDGVAFNNGGMGTFFADNWGSVKVDLVVNDQKRVVSVNDIVVDTNTIEVLLEQILEELVFLF